MQGSWSILRKNCVNLVPGLIAFTQEGMHAFKTWRKMYNRSFKYAPQDYIDQYEEYDRAALKKGISETKNIWIDTKLCEEVKREDVAQLMRYKVDLWHMSHAALVALCLGGYSLPLGLLWLTNDTWTPSCFSRSDKEIKAWRTAQDMYRYRSTPMFIWDTKWNFDHTYTPPTAQYERAWDELFEKNDIRRDPELTRPAAEMYSRLWTLNNLRRASIRKVARCMNIPTFPMLIRMCNSVRIRDYWNLAWNEDYMVISQNLLDGMNDDELYDYAWRRFLAPYDKNLTREELLQRISDYHTFLGPDFMTNGTTPNIPILQAYVMGYYHDPGYLEEDIAELDKNDFAYMAHIGKDAFLRRMELENGPLRDQVEAHTQKLLTKRAKQQKKFTDAQEEQLQQIAPSEGSEEQ